MYQLENSCKLSISIPLNAMVEKQSCGVKLGGGDGWVIMSFGALLDASTREDFCQKKFASMNQSSSVLLCCLLAS
jgi:hypothetical protein